MSWFSALFSSKPISGDPRIIDIVEQAIAVVDPRLRALPDYKARLLPAAEKAWAHVCTITRHMPPPVDLARERWSIDPLLRAVFATPDEIDQLFARSSEVQRWCSAEASRNLQPVTALLVMLRKESRRLGVSNQGEQTLHDVQQVTVDFDEHRLVCPSVSVPEMRQLIKRRALNQLYLRALDQIQSVLTQRNQLEQQRSMLQTRLRLLQGQGGTLSEMLRGDSAGNTQELKRLLDANAAELDTNHATLDTLDDYLKVVVHTLEHAEEYLRSIPVELRLDTMNVIVEDGDGAQGSPIRLTDVTFERASPYTVCVAPVVFKPLDGAPVQADLKNAERFL